MKKTHYFLTLLIIFIISCKNDDLEKANLSDSTIRQIEAKETQSLETEQLKIVALTGNNKIPIEEAKELAMQTALQMRTFEGIVTKAPLKIKSIEVINNGKKEPFVKTKGNRTKSDLYVLNFENNQGYVITSADRRVPGVFAYNSYGNLGDTIENPGQHIILEQIVNYIEQRKIEFKKNRIKLAIAAQEELFAKLSTKQQQELIEKGVFNKKGKRIFTKRAIPCFGLDNGSDLEDHPYHKDPIPRELPTYSYGEWETVYKKAPLVKTLWSQSGAYNDNVKTYCDSNYPWDKDKEAPVGCVAIALGQIMSYHKKPKVLKGKTLNWNAMTSIRNGNMFSEIENCNAQGVENIQYLLVKLGDEDLLSMNYGCGGSGASIDSAVNTFRKLGYESAIIEDYSSSKIINEVKNNRPLYIRGCASKKTKKKGWWIFEKKKTYYDDCHAWIIDGYVKRKRIVTVTTPNYDGCIHPEELKEAYRTRTYSETLELIHNNFGWGGELNGKSEKTGWYLKGIFDAKNNCSETSDSFKSSLNFKYQNKIITQIK